MSSLKGKNIILFGPPGIGKSTIIKDLVEKGYPAIDLEEIYPDKIRFQLPNFLHNNVLGAADLDPKRYNDQYKILLYLPQKEYDTRRGIRDQSQSGKATQKHHDIDAWKQSAKYNKILYADDSIVNKIINLLK